MFNASCLLFITFHGTELFIKMEACQKSNYQLLNFNCMLNRHMHKTLSFSTLNYFRYSYYLIIAHVDAPCFQTFVFGCLLAKEFIQGT